MDRAGRWLRSFLGGKKEQVANEENKKKKKQAAVPAPTGKERRRWSFRRSVDGNRMLGYSLFPLNETKFI